MKRQMNLNGIYKMAGMNISVLVRVRYDGNVNERSIEISFIILVILSFLYIYNIDCLFFNFYTPFSFIFIIYNTIKYQTNTTK